MQATDWLANASLIDEVEVVGGEAGPLERLARRRHGPDAHDRRVDARHRGAHDPRERRQAERTGALGFDEDARRRRRRCRMSCRPSPCRLSGTRDAAASSARSGVGARTLVAVDDARLPALLLDRDRHELVGEATRLEGAHRSLMAQRERVDAPGRRTLQIFDDFGGTDKPGPASASTASRIGHQKGRSATGAPPHRGLGRHDERGGSSASTAARRLERLASPGRWIGTPSWMSETSGAGGQGDLDQVAGPARGMFTCRSISLRPLLGVVAGHRDDVWPRHRARRAAAPDRPISGGPYCESRPVLGRRRQHGSDTARLRARATLQQSSQPWGTMFSGSGRARSVTR